jgi:uncharacterized protein involved in exopolysaccharide biosynthesis
MDEQNLAGIHNRMALREKSLLDYLDMVIRRKKPFLLISSLVLAITTSLVFGLPAIYKSTATISIQQQEISEDLVKSTIGSYAEVRVQEISKRIMTNARLSEIIHKLDLYSNYKKNISMEMIIEKMRDSVNFKMSDTSSKSRTDKNQPRTSFTTSFNYPKSPQMAQQVTTEIVALFLEENKNDRMRRTEISYSFLLKELQRLEGEADTIDLKLADFKRNNIGKLPEQSEIALKMSDRLERDIAESARQLFDLRQQNIILKSDLVKLNKYTESPELTNELGERIMSVEGRIQVLKSTYMTMLTQYFPEHPTLKNIEKEIESLGGNIDFSSKLNTTHKDLATKEQKLANLKTTLPPGDKDIKQLEEEINKIKENLNKLTNHPGITSSQFTKDINPAYVSITTQLKVNEATVQSLIKKKQSLEDKQIDIEKDLITSPMVAMEYSRLNRQHRVVIERIENVRSKLNAAEMSEKLESSQNAERFTLVAPPLIPASPISPNRNAIFALGTLLALGLGFLASSLFEMFDKTIYSNRVMAKITGEQPLTVIPLMETPSSKEKRLNTVKRNGLILAALAIISILFASYILPTIVSFDHIWSFYTHQLELLMF